MSYLAALQGGGPSAPPAPASLGLGPAPTPPGLPPAPTGKGPIPTGGAGGTRLTAAGDAIAAIRNFIGFAPELSDHLTSTIAMIKDATRKDAQANGPAVGQPGVPGSAQIDSSATLDSGGPGAM
jgi:hypothetical protein